MDEPLAYTLHRIPGLFRRWELAELMKPGEDYHIEDAGRASDGTPLLAVYSSVRRRGGPGMTAEPRASDLDLVIASHLMQAELAERWRVSPRTLERWRCAGTGPGLAAAERPGALPARGRARLRARPSAPRLTMTRGLFAEWQPRYAEHGIATFPVRGKVPAIRSYLRLRLPGSRSLVERFADASAFGFAPKPSGIVVVDVDTPRRDRARRYARSVRRHAVRGALGRGQLPGLVQADRRGTAHPPDPDVPIDILGDGFVVAPPSLGEKGSIRDHSGLARRSPDPANPEEPTPGRVSDAWLNSSEDEPVGEGHRNRSLWRFCMREAHHCDDLDDLLDVARTANADCLPPLADAEVVRIARSAWDYTERGQNLVGRQHVRISFEVVDQLLGVDPDAYVLLSLLLRHHADRRRFFIANAMAERMPPSGWALKRFRIGACPHSGGRVHRARAQRQQRVRRRRLRLGTEQR